MQKGQVKVSCLNHCMNRHLETAFILQTSDEASLSDMLSIWCPLETFLRAMNALYL